MMRPLADRTHRTDDATIVTNWRHNVLCVLAAFVLWITGTHKQSINNRR